MKKHAQHSLESDDNDGLSQSKQTEAVNASKPVDITPKVEEKVKPKIVSLFDDDDRLFEDDLFSGLNTKKFTSGLFDDSPPDTDIFADRTPNVVNTKLDLSTHDIEDTLSINSQKVAIAKEEAHVGPARESPPTILSKTDDVVDNVSQQSTVRDELVKESSTKRVEVKEPVQINIFDPTPPPDSSDWDMNTESNIFEENDVFSYEGTPNYSEQRTSLFENEPPSLVSCDSGIVRDRSSR